VTAPEIKSILKIKKRQHY